MAEFKLGRIKFVWKGPWQASTPYYKDDVVIVGGVSYMCINAYTSSSSFATDQANWQKMAGGTNFVTGGWSASTGFNPGDLVTVNGNVYYCTTAHTSASTWLSDISNWVLYSPGVKFRNTWTASTQYYINDLVKYGADIYICTTANLSSSAFSSDLSNWTIFVQGLEYVNTWNSSTTYAIGDQVTYGGYVYNAISVNVNQTPSTAVSYWSVVTTGYSQQGDWNLATAYKTGHVVTFGGWTYVCVQDCTNQQPYVQGTGVNSAYWSLIVKGFNHRGAYAKALTVTNATRSGSTVTLTFATQSSTPFTVGTNIVVTGVSSTTGSYNGVFVVSGTGSNTQVQYQISSTPGTYTSSTGTVAGIYYPGDVVLNTSSTYVATGISSNVSPPNSVYWQIIGQGGVGATLTEIGDLAYRYSDGTVTGLHMANGTQSGSAVLDGYVLKARTQGDTTMQPRWGEYGYISNIFYVSATSGSDGTSYGRTIDRPFATIRYACIQAASVATSTSPVTIFIKTGTYSELLPITVPAYVSLVGDELRTTIVQPAAGLSSDGVTPNNRSRMFLLNQACVLRNMTMGGLTGQFTGTPYLAGDTTGGSGIQRLTVGTWPSATASGAYCALDPNGSITSKSPYIQNCSTFGSKAVGLYINGLDQNRTGTISMVCNDFTQVIDDGIGIMCLNGGRCEAVSVFTYYAYIGYLCQSGGVLRATNGNNSYGTYGDVAADTDPTDVGYPGTVNNLANSAQIGNILVGNGQILAIYWNYCGQAYTNPTISLDSAPTNGTNASVSGVITSNALSHVVVTSPGSGYQFVAGTGRNGGTSSSGVWFALAATDKATANNQYQGMRITIVSGTGAGQTGIIANSYLVDTPSGTTKVVYVQTTAGAQGWETLVTGAGIVTALDASSQYTILPEVTIVGGGYSTQAVVRANIDPSTFTFAGVYILNGGAGYTGTPTFTVTDPQGSGATFTPQILSGAISSVTYTNRGAGYIVFNQVGLATSISDATGYANIAQTGNVLNFLGFSQAPRVGSIIIISGQAAPFLVVSTNSYTAGTGKCNVTVGSSVSTTNPLTQGATATVYQKFSQIRLTGHDYLAIGTGNFASTAYPSVNTASYITANQHLGQNNGRVFYTSTDQDGNFSVGDLFKINQATGQATLNVSAFNLAGLNSLQLGTTGAFVSQFSTDGTLSANSDAIVPTQKAIRTYISSQLGSGSNNLQVNVLTAGKVYIQNNIISSSPGTGSDIVFAPDGVGAVQFNSLTNYNYTNAQIQTQSYAVLANKDYVDQGTRENVHSLAVDVNGNLIWVNDAGGTASLVDASSYVDYAMVSRGTNLLINNATGNLQLTY